MKRYKEWSPTQFDCKGLGIPDRQNWYVAPCIKCPNTDDCLERANFDALLKALGGESSTIEIHSFNHWATGFELILINPRAHKKVKIANDIEDALSDYPVIDDELFSQYESDAQWENLKFADSDIIRELEEHFDIENLDLPESALSQLVYDEWIEFSSENWPKLKLEKRYSNTRLTLAYFINLGCEFTFGEDYSFESAAHPGLLDADLMRALAASKIEYTQFDGTPIDIPTWAYPNPNPNQITLNLNAKE